MYLNSNYIKHLKCAFEVLSPQHVFFTLFIYSSAFLDTTQLNQTCLNSLFKENFARVYDRASVCACVQPCVFVCARWYGHPTLRPQTDGNLIWQRPTLLTFIIIRNFIEMD